MVKKKSNSKWRMPAISFFLIAALFFVPVSGYSDEALDEQVAADVAGGQEFLFNSFTDQGDKGYYWAATYNDASYVAATAAAVAALIETGKYGDPLYAAQIDKAVAYIKSMKQANGAYYESGDITYVNGMSLVALSLYHTVNPQPEAFITDFIQPAVNYFLSGQYTGGGWGYSSCGGSCTGDSGDMSNTQFAIMGLWYAYHYALNQEIPTDVEDSWAYRLEDWVRRTQGASGSFGYYPGDTYYNKGPMNGAGLWTLAMLGVDQTDQAIQDSLAWFNDASIYRWTSNSTTWGSAYYYGVYGMAKGLAGMIPSDYQFDPSENIWVTDLKQAMVNSKTPDGDEGVCFWYSGQGLDPGKIIATSFVIMSLGFADPSTESTKKILPDTPVPDYPIKQVGFVTLESTGGVTISKAARGNNDRATAQEKVRLPIGSFDFTLNNVPQGGEAVLKIIPPRAALDPDNPDSFINADGSIKEGLSWFKIVGGEWKGQGDVPIRLMPVGGPYTYIEVTLTDGGPEDEDGAANGQIEDPAAPGYGAEFEDEVIDDGGDIHDNFCFISSILF